MSRYIDKVRAMNIIASGKNDNAYFGTTNKDWEVIDFLKTVPTANVIPIPKGATNGDVIEAMFPNCEQKEHMNNGYFEMYFDNDLKNASYMRVSKDWWNALYKAESEGEEDEL